MNSYGQHIKRASLPPPTLLTVLNVLHLAHMLAFKVNDEEHFPLQLEASD